MTLVIPPGFAQVGLEMKNAGDPDPWYITFGVELKDWGGDYEGAANYIGDAWEETFLSSFSTNTTFANIHLTIGQDGADNLIVVVANGTAGEQTAARLPQNCALLVRKNTALGGRRNRGRFFVPNVLPEDAVDNVGNISPQARSDYQDVASDFRLKLFLPPSGEEGSTPMVILHNLKPSSPLAPTPVTSLAVDGVISTQRRRLR